jgi:DNA polymerase III epsilon subunit-like protein
MSLREQPVLNQIMIDLETLDVRPTAVVVSIGAVRWNLSTIGDTFYHVLNMDDQQTVGRTISTQTMAWWALQSEAVRAVFDAPKVPTPQALAEFTEWLGPGNLQIWGNGADFDNIIWGSLYDAFNVKRPWSYSNNRCFRTIKNICLPDDSHDLPKREGHHHNALDDAVFQVQMAQRYLKGKLRWGL